MKCDQEPDLKPQRMRPQRRLCEIYTASFLTFMIPCNRKLVSSFANIIKYALKTLRIAENLIQPWNRHTGCPISN